MQTYAAERVAAVVCKQQLLTGQHSWWAWEKEIELTIVVQSDANWHAVNKTCYSPMYCTSSKNVLFLHRPHNDGTSCSIRLRVSTDSGQTESA